MAFGRKNTTDNSIPEDLKPYYEGRNTTWRRWAGPVLRGFLLFVLIALIVWGGIWGVSKLVHRGSDDNGSGASGSSQTATKSGSDKPKSGSSSTNKVSKPSTSTNKNPSPAPAPTPSSATSDSTSSSTPSAPQDTTPANTQNSQLANTGPGEVIAAFFATVVLATIAYHFAVSYRVSGARN